MNTLELVGQAVGILATVFIIFSYQHKERSRVIGFQLVGTFLFSVNFALLGAPVGAILNAVAVVRAVVFLNKEKLHAEHPLWLVGFSAVYLASYAATFTLLNKESTPLNLLIELLPVIGMVATTISFRFEDAKMIRRYGLISSPCWLIYNIASFSLGAIICEVISLGSIILGIYRFDRRKN